MAAPSGIFNMVRLFDFSTLGYLSIGKLLGISEMERELDRNILMETYLVLFSSFSGISTCLGDLELDNSCVILSLLIRRLIERLWDQ